MSATTTASTEPPADLELTVEPADPAEQTASESTVEHRVRWELPALATLLVGTAVLYLWGLGESGWANSFYSAAAQAGSVSWKAFFYGSSDAGNSITVDKTPASLWLMALSVRFFGLSSWSVLVPQALCGVAAVGVLYATVRRWYGVGAGLLAGSVLALTPVAVLMFRFNNPDALLVLLLVIGAYATVRAVETASTRWLLLVGALVGFGFLTKMLQALLVVPAFALTYLLAAPTGLWRRVRQLLLAGLAMVVAAGWWVAIVELVPASWRPYVGGSQTNSILELTFGYNGFGRITGDEVGSVTGGRGGGPNGGGMWGETGLTRLFNAENGGQIAWLLPAALILLVAGLILHARLQRLSWGVEALSSAQASGSWALGRARAGYVLWGTWLLVTMLTFSLMAGIFHAYYDVALAPAVGALVGIGVTGLWRRHDRASMLVLAGVIAVTALWAAVLLGRSVDFLPWLTPTILVVGLGAAIVLALAQAVPGLTISRVATTAALAAGVGAGLAGPAAYALDTAATAHVGAIPTAGPAVVGALGGPGGQRGGPGGGGANGQFPNGQNGQLPNGGQRRPGAGQAQGGQFQGGPFQGGPFQGGQFQNGQGGPFQGGPGGTARGGAGGLLNASTPSAEVVAALKANAESFTWVAATVGANNAAGFQLATEEAVMPIGGFNGSDPSPTLAQFQQYVSEGRIHYFIGSGGFAANGGARSGQEIATWVSQNFTATTVGGVTLYDLTAR